MPPTVRRDFSSTFILVLIPCAIVRFALFAPLGYYWTYGATHWDVIQNHLQLQTYHPAIVLGEQIASDWGTFAFYWNFAVWIPTFWFPPPLNLPFTAIDCATTIYIAWATSYQTGYVPHSKASCAGAAYSWHRPPGANESFFEAAGRLNATVATPVNMCKSFVEEWQYGIAISFFYALVSLLNLVAFFGAVSHARQQGESAKDVIVALCKSIMECMLAVPKGVVLILVVILWFLPESIFRCLPQSFKSKVRFGRRYALKTGLGLEQTAELGATELKDMYKQNQKKRIPRYQGGAGEPCPLSNFLGIYDILMAVTEEMHYQDVMNLSRVSKSVREVVLPAHDFDRRIETFRRYTCPGEQKTDCWICDKQVCTDCQHMPLITQTTLFHHFHNCHPYCTPCYQKTILTRRPPTGRRVSPPHCKCAPITAHPNFIFRLFHGSKYYTSKQDAIPKVARAVCQECNLHSAEELLEIREKRTKLELKRGLQDSGKKWKSCTWCKNDLGTGPRWWVCGSATCRKECRSVVHKGWARRAKYDRIVGEETV